MNRYQELQAQYKRLCEHRAEYLSGMNARMQDCLDAQVKFLQSLPPEELKAMFCEDRK